MTAARSVAVRKAAYANAYGPDENPHPGDRSQHGLIFQLAFVDVDVPGHRPAVGHGALKVMPETFRHRSSNRSCRFDVLRSRIRIPKLLVKEVPAGNRRGRL